MKNLKPWSHKDPVHFFGSSQWHVKASMTSSSSFSVPCLFIQLPCIEHPGRLIHCSQESPSLQYTKGILIYFQYIVHDYYFSKSLIFWWPLPSHFTITFAWSLTYPMLTTGWVTYWNSTWIWTVLRDLIFPSFCTSCFPRYATNISLLRLSKN